MSEFASFAEGVTVAKRALEHWARLSLSAIRVGSPAGIRFAHEHLRASQWALSQVSAVWVVGPNGDIVAMSRPR